MEVNCLTLKDLINPRQPRLDFAIEDGENAHKVGVLMSNAFRMVMGNSVVFQYATCICLINLMIMMNIIEIYS